MSYDWPHDCSNRGVEEITRSLATNHLSSREGQGSYIAANQAILIEYAKEKSYYITLHSNIYLSEPIFVKLANDFNLNIYHLVS